MATEEKMVITITANVHAPIYKVWNCWTDPKHIIRWNNASENWHTRRVVNDLRVGGRFLSRMEARDGSAGFDFTGKYNKIEPYKSIDYTLDDGRKVLITFELSGKGTKVTESFDVENTNPVEMQRAGWQAILDNFKSCCEKNSSN